MDFSLSNNSRLGKLGLDSLYNRRVKSKIIMSVLMPILSLFDVLFVEEMFSRAVACRYCSYRGVVARFLVGYSF